MATRLRFKAAALMAAAPSDCAIYVLDAGDRVVRHLAAGVLGPNAPAPLKKGSPAQSLLWDGRDDLGRRVGGGAAPFKVRARMAIEEAG